ncbi:hypothetical protein THAR02_06749 [Trichoderma harzianum]|uniref:Uncharacterized protein n=1 Tax=Trichoderma harzianum TaxID=5544 RepID=A0A0F9X7J0_TRIHA|nr:hypothetical protein THAR02_06749 [Trichoderma harzianum]
MLEGWPRVLALLRLRLAFRLKLNDGGAEYPRGKWKSQRIRACQEAHKTRRLLREIDNERLVPKHWTGLDWTGLDWTLSPVNRERGEEKEPWKVQVSSQGHKQGKALAGWTSSVRALWSRYRRRIIIRPAGSAQDSEEIEEAEV